jgi:hypothetical protein
MAYHQAKHRCTNANSPVWNHYGGRGIEFRFTSFEQFIAELGPRPSSRHSLDRIDNEGHYEPDNCRWATPKQQNTNCRKRSKPTRQRLVEFHGLKMNLRQWAAELGIAEHVLQNRFRRGWTAERAFTNSTRKYVLED